MALCAKAKTRRQSVGSGFEKIVVRAFIYLAQETRFTARHQSGDASKHDGRDGCLRTLVQGLYLTNVDLSITAGEIYLVVEETH